MEKFEIGDLVKFVDRTGDMSEIHLVVDIDDVNGKLTADRYNGGKFKYSISAAFEHFVKHRSVRDLYKREGI
jgi:hypothetical protein